MLSAPALPESQTEEKRTCECGVGGGFGDDDQLGVVGCSAAAPAPGISAGGGAEGDQGRVFKSCCGRAMGVFET